MPTLVPAGPTTVQPGITLGGKRVNPPAGTAGVSKLPFMMSAYAIDDEAMSSKKATRVRRRVVRVSLNIQGPLAVGVLVGRRIIVPGLVYAGLGQCFGKVVAISTAHRSPPAPAVPTLRSRRTSFRGKQGGALRGRS